MDQNWFLLFNKNGNGCALYKYEENQYSVEMYLIVIVVEQNENGLGTKLLNELFKLGIYKCGLSNKKHFKVCLDSVPLAMDFYLKNGFTKKDNPDIESSLHYFEKDWYCPNFEKVQTLE